MFTFFTNTYIFLKAAKGGHTNVVSVLIDYNPTTLTPADAGTAAPVVEAATAVEAVSGAATGNASAAAATRFPAEGHEGQGQPVTSSSQTPSSTTVTSLPNKSK